MRVRIVQGEALATLRELPSDSVDAVVTDPPYSSGGMYRSDRNNAPSDKYQQSGTQREYPEFAGDNRDQRSFTLWATLWLSECWRVAREGSPVLVFSDWRQAPSVTDALQAAGFVWRGTAVWDKTEAARPAYGRFRQQSEFILWGSKGPMPNCGEALPGVFRQVVLQADKHHTTGKPTALMHSLLAIVREGVVLDPFMGSGTTGVAAIGRGLSFIGVEMTREYCEIAHTRLSAVAASTSIEMESPVKRAAGVPLALPLFAEVQ